MMKQPNPLPILRNAVTLVQPNLIPANRALQAPLLEAHDFQGILISLSQRIQNGPAVLLLLRGFS
jgi:hypothetical protein